mmetsp:Transcript_13645/g.29653  ORF Transcript_13645/g.29653 Transcript_13645/m.29653 type:complete len:135 (+) Transcript_13645:165-569(+)
MKTTKLLILAVAACAQTNAFVPVNPALSLGKSSGSGTTILNEKHAPELSPIDEQCIENVAEFCLHEQCDLEEYEALVNQLQEQRDYMINHIVKVEHLLKRLKDSNVPDYNPEEVESLFGSIKETLANEPMPVGK